MWIDVNRSGELAASTRPTSDTVPELCIIVPVDLLVTEEVAMEHWHIISVGFLSASLLFVVGLLVLSG